MKCHSCEHCKTYAEKKGVTGRLFTRVCTRDFPNTPIVALFEGHIDKGKWESQECIKKDENNEQE